MNLLVPLYSCSNDCVDAVGTQFETRKQFLPPCRIFFQKKNIFFMTRSFLIFPTTCKANDFSWRGEACKTVGFSFTGFVVIGNLAQINLIKLLVFQPYKEGCISRQFLFENNTKPRREWGKITGVKPTNFGDRLTIFSTKRKATSVSSAISPIDIGLLVTEGLFKKKNKKKQKKKAYNKLKKSLEYCLPKLQKSYKYSKNHIGMQHLIKLIKLGVI